MNRLRRLAVVVSVVAGCAGSAPIAARSNFLANQHGDTNAGSSDRVADDALRLNLSLRTRSM
jgi:hypothetical protein